MMHYFDEALEKLSQHICVDTLHADLRMGILTVYVKQKLDFLTEYDDEACSIVSSLSNNQCPRFKAECQLGKETCPIFDLCLRQCSNH